MALDATVGGANANSFLTVAEADEYFADRIEVPEWEDADSKDALLITATRLLVAIYSAKRKLIRQSPRSESYYLTPPTWTGAVATTTQRLPWPRTGMYDRNGNAIASNVIPLDLKHATAEFAAHLAKGDRSFDSDVAVQGITSVRAGSVSVSFKDGGVDVTKIVPDTVWDLLVPSWLTEEKIEAASDVATFEVIG